MKAAQNSGFEYEYTSFPDKNVSFEIYPKEYENGTVITGLNSSQFNITLNSKTGSVFAIGNATWNASCSSAGCYEFTLQMPSAAGRYLLTVSLNYTNNEVQTVHRLISVTTTSLSATPLETNDTPVPEKFKEAMGDAKDFADEKLSEFVSPSQEKTLTGEGYGFVATLDKLVPPNKRAPLGFAAFLTVLLIYWFVRRHPHVQRYVKP